MADELIFKFEEVWSRIRLVTGWKRYGDFANFLGVKSAAISGAKARGTMPLEWAFRVAQNRSVSTEWLLTGQDCRSSFDFDLLTQVAQVVERVVEEQGVKLGWKAKGKLLALVFEDTRALTLRPTDEEIVMVTQKYLDLLETL